MLDPAARTAACDRMAATAALIPGTFLSQAGHHEIGGIDSSGYEEACMLHKVKQLKSLYLRASDGDLGTVEDFYFDDAKWTVRHLVVDTGGLLSGRLVLVPPPAVGHIDWDDGTVHVKLTKQQIEDSPGIDNDKPVSRQHEQQVFDYYGFPYYWGSPFAWGAAGMPGAAGILTPAGLPVDAVGAESPRGSESERAADEAARNDPRLRSATEVMGYTIHATDGDLGHVEDFLFDEGDWSLQMIEIDTRNWLPGRHVAVPVQRIREVSWDGQRVEIGMTREEISHGMDSDTAALSSAARPDVDRSGSYMPPRR